ncbi:hypothetical protein ACFVMC_27970 [Nocardia sp. NPDC127579]|uniref:hypothetical protein n=1 Tax=Nocardia sp. NPDC127579 TaxID=3345402 RepID=UPI003631135C
MIVDIAWWDLPESGIGLERLRADLTERRLRQWREVEGLSAKLWLADPRRGRWGAVMLWDRPPDPELLPPNRALELIGAAPTHRVRFDVAAVVRGR